MNSGFLIPLLLVGVVMYFILIRPQRAKKRQQKDLIANIRAGDEVVTIGGLYGDVVDVDDDTPTVTSNATVLLDDDALSGNPGGIGDDADAAFINGTLQVRLGNGERTVFVVTIVNLATKPAEVPCCTPHLERRRVV